ncbi:FACT complex component Spt16 [Schizosaccharomyces japonicus yFS275]|uniref:FACT complex subunit n=1 Tax=Schizosaccharomyces japonicus (strain yFS275 / FY16936) TaxID=402676 RepID=B6K2E8_SCHJY|nr:FACT complex component Spt16 [Schizosaccharomyces japonicus yFS275]EEB07329.1 FACT complex component Spt16 [Schizosaccharomyces japonicus yFS275]
MSEYEIDVPLFFKRIQRLLDLWNDPSHSEEYFHGIDSLLVVTGTENIENPYQKSAALHTWLLGYEFPQTLILFTKTKVTFLSSSKKITMLEQLSQGSSGSSINLEFLKRTKNPEENLKLFQQVIEAVSATNKKVGHFPKDSLDGKFVNEWKAALEQAKAEFEYVDVSLPVAVAMSVKDDVELPIVKTASRASTGVMTRYFADQLSKFIDEGKKISNSRFSDLIEQKIDDESFFQQKALHLGNMDMDQLEWCYTPIVQSGGSYDLKPSAISNDKLLHGGVVLCSLGLRYKSYCSNIGRTYLFDPNADQLKYYNFLVQLQTKVLELCTHGAVIKEIYAKAVEYVRSKYPELESHFVRNLGAGIGIEFRESAYLINAKNPRKLESGMTVNLSVGFANLENSKAKTAEGKVYSLLLIDTIQITKDAPLVFTESPKSHADISYYFGEDTTAEKEQTTRKPTRTTATISSHKGKTRDVDDSAEKRRIEHQKQLAAKKQTEGLRRFSDGSAHNTDEQKTIVKRYESYKRDTQLPHAIANLQILVDTRAQSIILPIFGRPVPFHISTLKNVSKNDEGDYVYIRLNFITPGQVGGKKDEQPFEDQNAEFIRSFIFRSAEGSRLSHIFKEIQDMKKAATKREAERKQFADVIEQDKLIEMKSKRPAHLNDVFVRPALDGKRLPGFLEVHQNGIRYQSPLRSDSHIDLLFSNMKHLFFQPCEGELIVLIHVHLKAPIMVGKRKTQDLQFYREVSDMQFDETGNRKRKYMYGDEDELEQEQEERRRRSQLDREFRAFAEKIAEASDNRIELDIPFRELAFSGVPFRANVLLQPTTDCLVQLTDTPFTVITLSEIEIAHLERVQFGLKNFDLVFVFKDFHRAPVHINTIPMDQLDNVKEWLDSCDICFYEGPLNLNWATIMKTVNDDPVAFFEEGGWDFLSTGDDEEAGESEEEVSEYEASGSDFDESEESEDYSDYEGEDEDSESEMEDEEESGEDWDELERKARQEDAKHDRGDERPMKRRR